MIIKMVRTALKERYQMEVRIDRIIKFYHLYNFLTANNQ